MVDEWPGPTVSVPDSRVRVRALVRLRSASCRLWVKSFRTLDWDRFNEPTRIRSFGGVVRILRCDSAGTQLKQPTGKRGRESGIGGKLPSTFFQFHLLPRTSYCTHPRSHDGGLQDTQSRLHGAVTSPLSSTSCPFTRAPIRARILQSILSVATSSGWTAFRCSWWLIVITTSRPVFPVATSYCALTADISASLNFLA
jgi:hypothetical protein